MFADLLPSIDLGAVGPVLLVVAAVAIIGWVFVGGAVRSVMSGDGHYGIIEAYVGFVRHGKTMLAVQDCIALVRVQRGILASNIGITCGPGCRGDIERQEGEAQAAGVSREMFTAVTANGEHVFEHVLLPLTDDGLDLDMVTDLALRCRRDDRALVLLIDEAGIVMPARQWATFPVGLMWLLQQSGKLRVTIRYTTQHPAFVDSQLRSLTAVVHDVRSTPPPSIRRRMQGKRPWFMTVRTTIPGDFDKDDKVLWTRRVRYRRSFEGSYNTDAAILPAGRLKGSEAFVRRLMAASDGLDLDPRLRAQLDGLGRAARERITGQLREAASFEPP